MITGNLGTFVTQWSYHPGGLMASMIYPDGETLTSYYHAGGRRIAMRDGGKLSWLIGDHDQASHDSGSTTVTADATGGLQDMQLYRAFGEVRPGPDNTLATRYTYTG